MCMNVCVCLSQVRIKECAYRFESVLYAYCIPDRHVYIIYTHMDHQLVEYEHHMFEPFI
jgi:hypothetical protein